MQAWTAKHLRHNLPFRIVSLVSLSVGESIADQAMDRNRSSDSLEAETKQKWPTLRPPTIDTSLTECARRNRILRTYVLKRTWDCDPEFKVLQNLLGVPTPRFWLPFHANYPLVYDLEWETFHVDGGHGDLVLTNGLRAFLVVELKFSTVFGGGLPASHRVGRTRKRRLARAQCSRNVQLWHGIYPDVVRTEGVVVTEEGILHRVPALERN